MENETQNQTTGQKTGETEKIPAQKRDYMLPASIFISSLIIANAWAYTAKNGDINAPPEDSKSAAISETEKSVIEESVLPSEGVVLPVRWGDLGVKMTSTGVIDKKKFEQLYAARGGLGDEERKLLEESQNGQIRLTEKNSGVILNLFWALGLGAKNDILEKGTISDPKYGGANRFASTGGWTLADGDAMKHFSRHPLIVLTSEQQKLVERVSKNVYRPCCGNSTYFPDCNHGMAMLGLLELMASQGISEAEMYRVALQVNSFWFPDTYITIATYMKGEGVEWKDVNPQEILGINYSSAQGYAAIAAKVVQPGDPHGGTGCGTDSGVAGAPQRQQGGCGI